jgi:Tfp pilus assembly protein FimV
LAEPASAGPVAPAAATAGSDSVVVGPGDTLWTIARRAQPRGDIRPLVDQLVAAHGSGPLQPGARVTVPD